MNKELQYQGKKISYRVTGKGRPVMLVHGFGEDATVWRNQVGPPQAQEGFQTLVSENSILNGKFKFIIPDLPGMGQSEMIDDMSVEGMAEVIKAIVDVEAPLSPEEEASPNPSEGGALDSDISNDLFVLEDSKKPPSGGRGAFILIGHSMGGYITLAFAEKYPSHLAAFGLFHSSAFADSKEKKVTRQKGIDFINQHGAFEFLKTATPNLFSPQSKNEKRGLVEEQVQASHNFSPRALVSYYEAMMKRPDRTAVLEKTTVPVLFIMGKYDAAVPMEDMLKQCHLPEKSYIHVLQNTGHMGMLEEAEKSNRFLENFLLEI